MYRLNFRGNLQDDSLVSQLFSFAFEDATIYVLSCTMAINEFCFNYAGMFDGGKLNNTLT